LFIISDKVPNLLLLEEEKQSAFDLLSFLIKSTNGNIDIGYITTDEHLLISIAILSPDEIFQRLREILNGEIVNLKFHDKLFKVSWLF